MIVGRQSEVEALGVLIDRARTDLTVLLVEGEAGIGKTSLLREGIRLAEAAGFSVLPCGGSAAESTLELAALADLVRPIPSRHWGALPSPQRRALEAALQLAEPDGRVRDRRAIGSGVCGLLAGLAAEQPILLALDDLHWIDVPSAAIVEFAVRRLSRLRIGILATERTTERPRIVIEAVVPPESFTRLRLRPLSASELRKLLATRLDVVPTRATLERVYSASGGNPLHALEIARLLADRGPRPSDEPLGVPDDVRTLIGDRVAALPEQTREMLLGAALLAHPEADVLRRALGSPAPGLQPVPFAGIARIESGVFRFAHPLHAAALVDLASPDERRRLHLRLADAIDDAEAKAVHLGLATNAPDEDVAVRLEAGADAAARRGRLHAAANLLERARALTPQNEIAGARRRGLSAVKFHAHAGERARARTLLDTLVCEPLDRGERGEALQLLGELRLADEDLTGAATALREALALADTTPARATIRLILSYVFNLFFRFGDAVELTQQALDELLAGGGDTPLLAEALARSAMVNFLAGLGVDRDKLDRALALHDPDLMTLPGLDAQGVVGLVLMYVGEFNESRTIMKTACARYAERGDEAELTTATLWLSWLELRAGRFSAAAEAADDAIACAKLTSHGVMGRLALAQRALVDAHTGDLVAARRRASEAIAPPGIGAAQINNLWLPWVHAVIAATHSDHVGAWAACRAGVEAIERDGLGEPTPMMFLPEGIEALVGLGELPRAARLVDQLEGRGRELDRVWALATGARCRGLLLAAQGDLAGALAAFDRALREHERVDMPFERARTLLCLGAVQSRARKRALARQTLGQAAAEFERLGAPLWAARAREALERAGAGRAAAPGELTRAERRAAQLAAAGHSNKEIAQALFVSVHTVEVHLSRIFAKLGIRSRAQLARRLPSDPGTR